MADDPPLNEGITSALSYTPDLSFVYFLLVDAGISPNDAVSFFFFAVDDALLLAESFMEESAAAAFLELSLPADELDESLLHAARIMHEANATENDFR